MIKCKVTRGRAVKMKARGSVLDLAVELLSLIMTAHMSINDQSEEVAKEFKRTILGVLLHPDSPIWKEDVAGSDLDKFFEK